MSASSRSVVTRSASASSSRPSPRFRLPCAHISIAGRSGSSPAVRSRCRAVSKSSRWTRATTSSGRNAASNALSAVWWSTADAHSPALRAISPRPHSAMTRASRSCARSASANARSAVVRALPRSRPRDWASASRAVSRARTAGSVTTPRAALERRVSSWMSSRCHSVSPRTDCRRAKTSNGGCRARRTSPVSRARVYRPARVRAVMARSPTSNSVGSWGGTRSMARTDRSAARSGMTVSTSEAARPSSRIASRSPGSALLSRCGTASAEVRPAATSRLAASRCSARRAEGARSA